MGTRETDLRKGVLKCSIRIEFSVIEYLKESLFIAYFQIFPNVMLCLLIRKNIEIHISYITETIALKQFLSHQSLFISTYF